MQPNRGYDPQPYLPAYKCLSEGTGKILAQRVDRIRDDSNSFSVVLPGVVEPLADWNERIQAARDYNRRKRHVDLGQPVVTSFFDSLKIQGVEGIIDYCEKHDPPLEVDVVNFDAQQQPHFELLEHLDAVPLNPVVVTFAPKKK